MSTAMIAITTNSSINVNPGGRTGFVTGLPIFLMATPAGKRVMEDGAGRPDGIPAHLYSLSSYLARK
jgi:hypothetical protein